MVNHQWGRLADATGGEVPEQGRELEASVDGAELCSHLPASDGRNTAMGGNGMERAGLEAASRQDGTEHLVLPRPWVSGFRVEAGRAPRPSRAFRLLPVLYRL